MDNRVAPATYVFFDCEGTDLFGTSTPPNITEMCFIAVKASHLNSEKIRISNEMLLCVKPKVEIVDKASQISGLTNAMLADFSHFSANTASLIKNYFKHLEQPVCLVAHNGICYDFPLILIEMAQVGMADICHGQSLLYLDTWALLKKLAIRIHIHNKEYYILNLAPKSLLPEFNASHDGDVSSGFIDDVDDDELCASLDEAENGRAGISQYTPSSSRLKRSTTPLLETGIFSKKIKSDSGISPHRIFTSQTSTPSTLQAATVSTPTSTPTTTPVTTPIKMKVNAASTPKQLQSPDLKLESLFRSLYSENMDSHTADGDTRALLKVFHKLWPTIKPLAHKFTHNQATVIQLMPSIHRNCLIKAMNSTSH